MDINKLRQELKLDEIKKLLLEKIDVSSRSLESQEQMPLVIGPPTKSPDDITLSIDLIERILELLRFEQKHFENRLDFERFVQGSILIDDEGLHYSFPQKTISLGSGTPSIRLQTRLLMFLLLHHGSTSQIFDIIDNFVRNIWDQLNFLDFKKTRTGATRCFTNTRFASNTLRDYGFIKFTDKEAYKTWVLSLPGFLVASKVVNDKNWVLPEFTKVYKSDLHPDIHLAYEELKTYDQFVERLAAVCKPDVSVFKTFGPILNKAYDYLEQYWKALKDETLTIKARKKKSLELLARLEKEPTIEEFYNEFSACINIDNLLKTLKK
jgi:hypothetical protein